MTQPNDELVFRIQGMDCAEEVRVLKQTVGPLVGGEDKLTFDILNARMRVHAANSKELADRIRSAVASAGMRASLASEASSTKGESARTDRLRTMLTAFSGMGLLAGFISHGLLGGGWRAAIGSGELAESARLPFLTVLFYGIACLAGVWLVLPKAWLALRSLRPDMNLLMTVAVLGAIAINQWFEAAAVSFLFAFSLLLESWSVGRARRAIAALLDLAPPKARVDRNGGEEEIALEDVAIGDLIVIRPGERIPIDGQVKEGASDVNQAPITGESQPVEKTIGSDVFAGTINGDGALKVMSTRLAGQSMLASMIRMVGEAQSRRAPSEQWVEQFAKYYTPSVMGVALLVLLVPSLLFNQPWDRSIYNSLVLLVIACPCALVISTPVSVVAALTAAARQGVLIKGGMYVEAPAHLRAIALDKTGTLTMGQPSVVEIVALSAHEERDLLERAAAMEQRSDHPLAKAIVEYARLQGVKASPAEDFQLIQGKGATARFEGRQFWLGSHKYLEERGQETPELRDRLQLMSSGGRTIVVIGNEEHVCGLIALADQIRPRIRETLGQLRTLGIQHLIMLTGDNAPTAKAIGDLAGIDEVRAELLPADKIAVVEELVQKYGQVAMVGDGVNDAPALARASLGIAMGSVGSDAAIETADIALMADDVSRLPWLIEHSRRTLRIIRQNIAFSLAVKAVFVVLTFAGIASLWLAIAADTGASLLVVANGLRLLRGQVAP
ncbi:heavy metal translocating P-type ATPase [Planctomicrobium piriforme]|uniref:P-type Zn(2+) transporter n=1 Tax=Planctomicrobium piriforme TaxID=1576369 RepID=A0A1I3R987_9PLAN|nr:heavy metal translocating P-type ATPase [Planctomicrobium piriforme]SFJ43194.1 Cd2+/Zn2+-exporting ATPase [Planctomicrobium piriforme]